MWLALQKGSPDCSLFFNLSISFVQINCGFFVMAISIMCKHQKRGTDKSKFEVVR